METNHIKTESFIVIITVPVHTIPIYNMNDNNLYYSHQMILIFIQDLYTIILPSIIIHFIQQDRYNILYYSV